jgi:hypothetical protein
MVSMAVVWLVACGEPATEASDALAVPPEPVELAAGVDRAVATTGDVITYTLEVDHDAGIEVKMPELGSEIAGFRIIDLGSEMAPDGKDRVLEKAWYQLRADLVGSYVLPSAEVLWREVPDEGDPGEWTTAETSQIFIEVASVLPEGDEMPEDIRDIKALRPPPPAWSWGAMAAGGGALGVLALAALWWWWSQRERVEPPPPPAHEVAYAALDALRDVDASDLEAVRRWYFDISEVLRTYVEGRFGLNATDLTTEEILGRMSELDQLTAEQRSQLQGFLLDTDQVKYAAMPPTEAGIERSYERALGFVEATAQLEADDEDEVAHG